MAGMHPQEDPPEASTANEALADLLPEEDDLLYEEELLRNPYSIKMWLRYLATCKATPRRKRYVLYERALHALPGSYKVRDRYSWQNCKFKYHDLQHWHHKPVCSPPSTLLTPTLPTSIPLTPPP
jgi:hypothetical protein